MNSHPKKENPKVNTHVLDTMKKVYTIKKVMVQVLDILAFGYSYLKKDEIWKCFLYCVIFLETLWQDK